jgi:hypothetical protein
MRRIKGIESCHECLQLAGWPISEFGTTTGWLANGPKDENSLDAASDIQAAARRMACR